MSKGVFITGTDTGVGKTIVSAVITRALIQKGIKSGVMKPIETGCSERNGLMVPTDGMFLREMAGMNDSIDLLTPVRYKNPLAPLVAAEIENRPVDIDAITSAYEVLSGKYDFIVVEGVGGLLVPIARRERIFFVSDLIKKLALPVIIVARPGLGTINHTLLTVHHALREGLNVTGVIINHNTPPENSLAEKTNPEVLSDLCPVPIIGTLPYMSEITKVNIDRIAEAIAVGLL